MLEIQCLTFNPFQENTYLVINEKKDCIIIDPGCYFEEERKELLTYIEKEGLNVTRLLNTHCHLDHIFGNRLVAKTYGVGLEMHILDKIVLDRSPEIGKMYNVPFEPSPEPIRYLEAGEKIKLGDDELEVLLTPGHSPGSVCFYCAGQQLLIGGDVLFYQSIGRTDLPGGSHQTLINSIREKLFVLPDEVIVYPGHGQSTTIGFEKKNNPFLH
ncbi:Glyoxylase, beta-lactamase superfamily II [Chitinophaga sp. CF118]|uniref:MBL fold metallo-hydrolase n=1 Tax=Chitinophaga sp. CF118 TaxID=1884367 RepID=UPI0008E89B8C|nr:MBL fold metallo-hydrolase [Chitinophaga sp. CF118]SFD28678.1 Glyoxylase, beta-lactamase superfamily II [Chitinophaga sp. CF118]